MWLLLFPLLFAALASEPAAVPPVRLDQGTADRLAGELSAERAQAEKWLRSDPSSYLATIERKDFGGKTTLTIGRDADNDLRLEYPEIYPHHLRVTVEKDRFRVEAVDKKARFRVDKEFKREAVLGPSTIGLGRYLLRLSHQGYPAIIVFDPNSPRFAQYKGMRFFPFNAALRYELPLVRNDRPDTTVILSTRGNRRWAIRVGSFSFLVGETSCRLEAVRLLEPGVDENEVSVFFRDATTGVETYPVGRYVDPVLLKNGLYLLDFNKAYNPACAYSDHYNCPIPPQDNTLPVAIRAGEMNARYH